MDELFERKLTEKLSEEEVHIPESYEKKIRETIEKIQNSEEVKMDKRTHWIGNHKVAGVLLVLGVLSVISGSSYATVNRFRERMNELPKQKVEKYNLDVQNSKVDADGFSRELTKEEEERFLYLRKQYETKGVFPQKEITEVENQKLVIRDTVCFVPKESKFYLPQRTLSDEEILEIIDLQEKRDYSLQKQNKREHIEVSDDSISKKAVTAVENVYGVKSDEIKIVSSERDGADSIMNLKNKETQFLVSCSGKGVVEGITMGKENLPAHSLNVKLKKKVKKSMMKSLEAKVKAFTGANIEKTQAYGLMNDRKELAYGTISCYCEMSDGRACVAVYSMAYQNVYEIYILENASQMQKEIKRKQKQAKEAGQVYRLL